MSQKHNLKAPGPRLKRVRMPDGTVRTVKDGEKIPSKKKESKKPDAKETGKSTKED